MNINLILRKTSEEDLNFVINLEREEENSLYVGQWTRAEHFKSLENPNIKHLILEDNFKNYLGYAIIVENFNKKIIEIKRIVIKDKNKGLGKLFLDKILKYYFLEKNSQRIWLDVRLNNLRAQHLYKKSGFKTEGILKQATFFNGEFYDLMVLSILKDDYFNKIISQTQLLNNLTSASSLEQLQQYFGKVFQERGFNSQSIKDKLMFLIEEVGELAKAIRKNQRDSLIDNCKNKDCDSIESEVADVFIILISICNLLNIDLFEAIYEKEKINSMRTWNTPKKFL